MTTPFITDYNAKPGAMETLAEGLARVLAPNPSPMTFKGTNTYLLGEKSLAVIDPGPMSDSHLEALLEAIGDRQVSHIMVTHSHLDHSELSKTLAKKTGAPIVAYGNSFAGQSDRMKALDADSLKGGEGIDMEFAPDITVKDGDVIEGEEWTLETVWTPGHLGNHACFAWKEGRGLFSGDHVMTWATSMISPPSGDLTDFMNSLERLLLREEDKVYYPGHGTFSENPKELVTYIRDHRKSREQSIIQELGSELLTPIELTRRIYTDVSESLLPAAERNVLAHLIDLVEQGRVAPEGKLGATGKFRIR